MAGCRKRLAGDCEGSSTLEHESKCAKVHRIVASLSPMKTFHPGVSGISMGWQLMDGKTLRRVVGFTFVLSIAHQCGRESCLSS